MVALNFKAQFAADVENGNKRRTIRAPRKDRRDPKPGDMLQLYTGLRQKGARKLRDAECIRVRPVEIDSTSITLDGHKLYHDGDFARADGFETFADMRDFFEEQHGLPFKGLLIEWRSIQTAEGTK